jgi:hypothetical protein
MTYGALAMFVGAILFPGHNAAEDATDGHEPFRIGATRAGGGLRRSAPGDPDVIEDDYYRFLRAPRD